jgi:hypothetical protein
MKKNFPLIIIVLLLVTILAYLKYNKSKSNFEEIAFNISDVKKIGSISISDKNGNKTVLANKNGKWMVNDSSYAEHAKILLLLNTLHKIQIEMPVGDSMRKMAIQDLRTLGKEISVKDNDGNELKTFFLGSQMGVGNNMILSQNGQVSPDPYIVKLPGIKTTDLKHGFPAMPDAWYSTEVFSTPVDKIKTITVNYHDKPQFSFKLTKDEDIIKIDPLIDSLKIDKPLNKEHVVQFLLEFERKNFEGRLKNDSAILYIKNNKPSYTIELEDMLNEKRYIKLYKIPSNFAGMDLGGKTLDATGKKLPFNIEKYWAYASYTREYGLAQHYAFGPILVPYSYFFEEKN